MRDNKKSAIVAFVIGIIPVIWIALLIAPNLDGGIISIIGSLSSAFQSPFKVSLCKNSLKSVITLLMVYGLTVGVVLSSMRNYRRGEEHGSAKWGKVKSVAKTYIQQPYSENKILTQQVMIGLKARKHRRNLNVLVCGGSGSGKTLFYAKPNIMQCNTSMVILDCNGKEVLGYILQAVH